MKNLIMIFNHIRKKSLKLMKFKLLNQYFDCYELIGIAR